MKETDWTLTCLGELAEVRDEKTMPSPDDARAYVGLEHIAQGRPKLLGVGRAGDVVSHKTVFKAGDILFGKLRPALRKVVRPDFDGVCSTDILAVYPKSACDGPYLQQLLHSNLILAHALRSAEGTKMPRTSWADLRSYRFLCPPPKERARIGEILAAVDDGIEKTEAVIEATERLRQALLQELLSRGIPGRHSEWKHAPGIGTIPACWGIACLGDLSTFVTSGSRGWATYYAEEGSAFVRITNLKRTQIRPELTTNIKRVAVPLDGEGIRTRVSLGDILISITADLGIIAVAPLDIEGAYVNQHIALVRPRSDLVAEFIGYALAGTGQGQFRAFNDAGAKAGLNLNTVRNLKLPVPSINEQRLIAATIEAVEVARQKDERVVDEIQGLKVIAAEELLTGRIPLFGARHPRQVGA